MTSRTPAKWLAALDRIACRDRIRTIVGRHGRWAPWLVPGIYAGCLAAFITDLTSADTLAFGVFYVPLVATAVFHRDQRAVWILSGIACIMVIVGAFIPSIALDVTDLIWNRTLSICAIFATAIFVRHARSIQDRLSEQTNRAEAAERIKTEVLTKLSEEIRAPLYSMIGVLELLAMDTHPDQKATLEMVRSSGRRLATTVDNLVDLTQFGERPMPVETVDLGLLLRQTAEARRQDATSRQINLTIDIPLDGDSLVHSNPWALRRILENKIADAITYTAPGGRIVVSTEAGGGDASAVIASTGNWPPAVFKAGDPQADTAPLMPSVMGLALSQRLARAIDARLVFSDGPGEGTTVRLLVPCIARPEHA